MANNFETRDFVHFLRITALINAAASGMGRWRLIVHVPKPPEGKIMEALAAIEAACELTAHAIRELEELEASGTLRTRAASWHSEGERLMEEVRALLNDRLPRKRRLKRQRTIE